MASKGRKTARTTTRTFLPRGVAEERDAVVVRFAGDTGDGVHLVASRFTNVSAIYGNAVFTRPDAAAEIRAPVGTLAGVSAFQVHFGKDALDTPGDALQALVAMNPAALRANLGDLEPGGFLIVNANAFLQDEWEKAGYLANPLEDGTLESYRVVAVPMNQLNREAVARVNLNSREVERCRSFFALGLVSWLFDRPLEPTQQWIREIYAKNAAMIEGNTRSLDAGHQYAESCRALAGKRIRVGKGEIPAGRYRMITGNDALALGVLAAAHQTKLPLVFAGFPLPPANDLLHRLCEWKQPDVKVIQAEDDLAALNLALGASFGGALGVTATAGPGLTLQADALGLAVISELPCVIIALQRAGPSAGMPGKTEQADLLQAIHGRNGESPLVVLAPSSPADCFATVLEAARLAIRYMTPVIVLADLFLAQGGEVWQVPAPDELPTIVAAHPAPRSTRNGASAFQPYRRDDRLARPWALPGTPGLEHRTGGLEKEDGSGNVCYDPLNHATMIELRARKIDNVANELPPLEVHGPAQGQLLVLGWGSTCGAIRAAVERRQNAGRSVAFAQLRHVHPLPKNLSAILKRYRNVLVPELNAGQLRSLLRSAFLVDVLGLNKLQGQPFSIAEIETKIDELS